MKRQAGLTLVGIFLSGALFAQTIFQSTDVPAVSLQNEGQPIQTGVKFRSSQNGYITGIRYYKGAGTTGKHIGQLWSSTGTLLASANFENETASGWQQTLFADPFAITAGVTYVATSFSSSGDYAYTNSYFNAAVVNGPLQALASGDDGPNGVYILSQDPSFPSNSYQASNYWVDVVFATNIGTDVYPPVITSVSPGDGALNVDLNTVVKVAFNETLDMSTVNTSNVELRNSTNDLIAASVTYTISSNTVILTPASPLIRSTFYTATVKGGQAGIKDAAGNPLANDFTWSFTTSDPPFISPAEGYGGPILVLSDGGNSFSRYTTEILRAEGLNEFAVKDISTITSTDLTTYDVILLGQVNITSQQVSMLNSWVNEGGTLICFKPDASLYPLLGISSAGGTLSDKYILVNTASGPGAGIVNQTMQFHSAADLYTLNGASTVATLYSDANTSTANPAITTMNVGSKGGKAIAFAYDLAKSIVYTRQGNPAWVGQKRDGQTGPVRSDDLFYPDWIDFNKIAIPQADEQQRLLANIILQGSLHRKPLPRLWYLPKGVKAAIVMTGDDHANNGTTGRFNQYLAYGSNTAQDVADWNAIRGTSYIYPNTPITNTQAAAFEAQGFEIALHPTTNCDNFTASSLENNFASQLSNFSSAFPGLSSPVTNRTHCMPWSDWSTHAQTELNHGMRLDVNYYYWPAPWIQNRPGMFTGSGFPMRFSDINGNMIDCYQATTQMTDESGITVGNFCDELLNKATGPEGYYGVFVANMHTDSATHTGSEAIIASAIQHKVPVIAAKQLLRWTDGRNNTSFGDFTWNNGQLTFSVTVPSGARNLNLMLPYLSEDGQLISVSVNNKNYSFGTETIKGIRYAFVTLETGTNTCVANYNASLVIKEQPSSQAACEGSVVTFTSSATASPAPSVQWQLSTDSNTWTNINGANSPGISVTATIVDNGKKYRAVWTNVNDTVISVPATLTVNPIPVLTSTVTPPPVTSGVVFNYSPTANIAGTVFTWQRDAITGISNTAANGTGSISETLINTTNASINVTYVYTLTANSCTHVQSIVVKVDPSPTINGCVVSASITANFNSTSIPAGRYIWFNSIFKAGNIQNRKVTFTISNGTISYSANNQSVTLNVPDGRIVFDPALSTATTVYSSNNTWETKVPANTNVNVFMTGLSYKVLASLPGGIKNVKWTMNIAMDQPGVTIDWKWTAGVYSNFASNAGLNVKPTDGLLNILNPLLGIASAGTPLNYSLNIVAGAMGAGLLNITSTYSSTASLSCSSTNTMRTLTQAIGATEIIPDASVSTAIQQQAGIENIKTIKVVPNPTTTYFNITVNGSASDPVTIRVLDILGRVIERHEKINTGTVLKAGESWRNGVYFIEIDRNNQRKIIKVVKAN